jgi:predicted Zn-dependent protease
MPDPMKTIFKYLPVLMMVLTGCIKPASIKEEQLDKPFHFRNLGESAKDLLSDDRFTALVVEIQFMTGFKPDETAVSNLKDFLYEHLHKPAGISIVTKEIQPAQDSVLTIDEVWDIEKKNRTAFSRGKTITVYILYTNGNFIENHMLGYAYRNTSVVLFGRNIHENSNKLRRPSRTYVETRVLQHELGHLLGLVNTGSPLQSGHNDAEHGKHCINKQCVMYHITDTEDVTSFVLNKEMPKLDKACLEDLKANGGKEEVEISKQHYVSLPFIAF